MRDGFLNLLKPPGMTSSDAVVMVRKTLPRGAKVGHMGTLDPEASGVLPIGIGKAARLFDYVSDKEKGYRAEIRIGVETDTQDATGRITGRGGLVTAEQLQGVLPQFEGDIEQIPSQYSAIKVGGRCRLSSRRRAWCPRRARRQERSCRCRADGGGPLSDRRGLRAGNLHPHALPRYRQGPWDLRAHGVPAAHQIRRI